MFSLRTRQTCPPGGFIHVDLKTGWNSRKESPESQWDFGTLVSSVRRYRTQHPELGMPVEPDTVANEMDAENALRVSQIEGAGDYVVSTGAPLWVSGGPFRPNTTITIRRSGALGDVMAATCLVSKLKEHGIGVIFQSEPANHCLLRRVPDLVAIQEPKSPPDVNLDGVYESDPHRTTKHFSRMFVDAANTYLAPKRIQINKPSNCTPTLTVNEEDRNWGMEQLIGVPRPWIMICPKSQSWAARTVPNEIWQRAAVSFKGSAIWLGMDPAPAGMKDLKCRHVDNLVRYLSVADLLVTVDTGPMHMAAALGIPTIAIQQASSPELHLSDQNDFEMISPHLDCLNCQKNICPINATHPPCQAVPPLMISEAVNRKLDYRYSENVSCVVSIWRPNVNRLNRCLTQVVDQVSEVIVSSDTYGEVPDGALKHPKIRYVKSWQHDIGYGRKANFGARHTSGKYILFLNDDCFLEPDVVGKLKELMVGHVGVVTHLLRYPEGTIQYGGKYREPAQNGGWSHLDFRQRDSRFKEPVEMEAICGASMLVRREAFFKVRGHDEDYQLYCEDDDIGMKIRQAGWKLIFTPNALGIHEEHQSTSHTPGLTKMTSDSCALFGRKWKWYLDKNKFTIPGTFA